MRSVSQRHLNPASRQRANHEPTNSQPTSQPPAANEPTNSQPTNQQPTSSRPTSQPASRACVRPTVQLIQQGGRQHYTHRPEQRYTSEVPTSLQIKKNHETIKPHTLSHKTLSPTTKLQKYASKYADKYEYGQIRIGTNMTRAQAAKHPNSSPCPSTDDRHIPPPHTVHRLPTSARGKARESARVSARAQRLTIASKDN